MLEELCLSLQLGEVGLQLAFKFGETGIPTQQAHPGTTVRFLDLLEIIMDCNFSSPWVAIMYEFIIKIIYTFK